MYRIRMAMVSTPVRSPEGSEHSILPHRRPRNSLLLLLRRKRGCQHFMSGQWADTKFDRTNHHQGTGNRYAIARPEPIRV